MKYGKGQTQIEEYGTKGLPRGIASQGAALQIPLQLHFSGDEIFDDHIELLLVLRMHQSHLT